MPDLLIAILIALNSLFSQNTTVGPGASYTDQEILKQANYIFENNLYKVNDGGVVIDPGVSL